MSPPSRFTRIVPACRRVALSLVALVTATFATPLPAAPDSPGLGVIGRAQPGPWGEVEYTRIFIEPPDEFMAPDYFHRDYAVWNFPGHTPGTLEALWRAAGLEDWQVAELREPANLTRTNDGISVRAPARVVSALTPAARATVYRTLASLPGNPLHQMPFRFRAELADAWLADANLPDAVVAEVRRLSYQRGTSLLFSDPDLVLPLLPTAAERVRLIKALSRKPTLLARLRVRPTSDLDALANYWGQGPRRKDVRPLLQSLTRHRDGISLDLAHLLPRFARGLLYTYPPRTEPLDQTLDCHWTSLNFFRDAPDPRLADLDVVRRTLARDYTRVDPAAPRLLGDVLVLTKPDGEIVHSCVQVADDLVFTKNGYSYQMPWVLSTIPDMLAAYPEDLPLVIHVFRRAP